MRRIEHACLMLRCVSTILHTLSGQIRFVADDLYENPQSANKLRKLEDELYGIAAKIDKWIAKHSEY